MNFDEYLKRKEYTNKTIASFEGTVKRFLQWLEKESTEPENTSYADMLVWMKQCQKKEISQRSIQHSLGAIKHYFDYLVEQKQIENNPALGIEVKGIKRKTLYTIFEPHELHAIYNSHPDNNAVKKRDKVILSLLVYQGLRTEDLERLEVDHVKLREGKVEIPGSRRSNGRTLQLEAHQVLELHDYVNQSRKEILKRSNEESIKLFVSPEGNGVHMHNMVGHLVKRLRDKHKNLINAKQIRASVIVKWLKQYNLREVQYLAGHRYISSTEAYLQSEMEGMMEEIDRCHPLG
jgi:integrase/recombinase XerD